MKEQLEQTMTTFIEKHTVSTDLKEAMLYSLQAGGKRIRPLLFLETIQAFGHPLTKGAYEVASCLEMIHTYSLIHDDLPEMDNDDLRRGKPTNHKVFGQALAVLAGDGLLTGAFELLGKSHNAPEHIVSLVQLLAQKAGNKGMVSGQVLDIKAEGKQLSLEQMKQIHLLKTGALLEFSFMAGGILTNQKSEILTLLEQLGYHFGLAFQIRDDLLDVESTAQKLGKNPHQDEKLNKSTYPKLLGLSKTKEALEHELKKVQQCVLLLEENVDGFSSTKILEKVEKLKEK